MKAGRAGPRNPANSNFRESRRGSTAWKPRSLDSCKRRWSSRSQSFRRVQFPSCSASQVWRSFLPHPRLLLRTGPIVPETIKAMARVPARIRLMPRAGTRRARGAEAEAAGAAASANENQGQQPELTLATSNNSNATSDSFLLQGTVGQSLGGNGPGGFGGGGLVPGTPGDQGGRGGA